MNKKIIIFLSLITIYSQDIAQTIIIDTSEIVNKNPDKTLILQKCTDDIKKIIKNQLNIFLNDNRSDIDITDGIIEIRDNYLIVKNANIKISKNSYFNKKSPLYISSFEIPVKKDKIPDEWIQECSACNNIAQNKLNKLKFSDIFYPFTDAIEINQHKEINTVFSNKISEKTNDFLQKMNLKISENSNIYLSSEKESLIIESAEIDKLYSANQYFNSPENIKYLKLPLNFHHISIFLVQDKDNMRNKNKSDFETTCIEGDVYKNLNFRISDIILEYDAMKKKLDIPKLFGKPNEIAEIVKIDLKNYNYAEIASIPTKFYENGFDIEIVYKKKYINLNVYTYNPNNSINDYKIIIVCKKINETIPIPLEKSSFNNKFYSDPDIEYYIFKEYYEKEKINIDITDNSLNISLKPEMLKCIIEYEIIKNINSLSSLPNDTINIAKNINVYSHNFKNANYSQKWEFVNNSNILDFCEADKRTNTVNKTIRIKRKTKNISFTIKLYNAPKNNKIDFEYSILGNKTKKYMYNDIISFYTDFPVGYEEKNAVSVSLSKPKGYNIHLKGDADDKDWANNTINIDITTMFNDTLFLYFSKLKTYNIYYFDVSEFKNKHKVLKLLNDSLTNFVADNDYYFIYVSNNKNPFVADNENFKNVLNSVLLNQNLQNPTTDDIKRIRNYFDLDEFNTSRPIIIFNFILSQTTYNNKLFREQLIFKLLEIFIERNIDSVNFFLEFDVPADKRIENEIEKIKNKNKYTYFNINNI